MAYDSCPGEEDDALALVRVYCGLASADETARTASAALTIAVVDDAGRLLGVHEIGDDPAGYARLGALLVERTSGFAEAAIAADSDDHVVTSLLCAAGRPLVVADDDSTDDFAERFADDDSAEEIHAPAAARRAVGLARALQAGAIAAVNVAAPRDLVSFKPVLAAHVALLNGRHGAAIALREVLRELYPAALRAYPDPAHPLALAVLDAVPEPTRLAGAGAETQRVVEQIVAELSRNRVGSEDGIIAAVTALSVAISESPRRGGVNKSLAPVAAKAIRSAIAAVRACDAACADLIGTLAERTTPITGQGVGQRGDARRSGQPTPVQPVSPANAGRFTPRGRTEPAVAGSGLARPQPLTAPPVAPDPVIPPPWAPRPAAPAASAAFPNRAPAAGNRPISVPPPPPGMAPITPGARPVPGSRTPAPPPRTASAPASAPPNAPASASASVPHHAPASASASVPHHAPASASASVPRSAPASASVSPADSGQPFQATLTNAAISNARAERQRSQSPARPATDAPPTASATDYSLPMPAQRPAQPAEPGSRANWPLVHSADDDARRTAPISAPPVGNRQQGDGRVRPPWQDDIPTEPPSLRLVEPRLGDTGETTVVDLPRIGDPPPLRLIDGDERGGRGASRGGRRAPVGGPPASPTTSTADSTGGTKITALDRSATPPVPVESNDGDLLIFAAARSAWFTGHDSSDDLDWTNPSDTGWHAAEKAATPAVADETPAGLPRRVPQANLVPGSPLRDERPLRIVRDAASIAAHTTGYFRGWRRGQEIGGFAMGGRPGRDSAGGWDFTREGQGSDDYRDSAGYRSS